MKYLKNVLFLLSFIIIYILNPNILSANTDICDNTISFINNISNETLNIVNSEKFTSNQKRYHLSDLLVKNADFKTMGKVALGRYSRKLPKEKEDQYIRLIQNMVTQMIHSKFDTNVDEVKATYAIKNRNCNSKGSKNREFLVDGDLLKNNSKLTSIRWWIIINKTGEYKVIDISLAGVSLALQKREEFSSFLSKNSIDDLINNLSEKFE
jgi:phospholipid transport system substrate-binding protein|tara:strand:+ start:1612 stop:2241 length:630 start_codon:yes stop_codon:yes gene_type:complete